MVLLYMMVEWQTKDGMSIAFPAKYLAPHRTLMLLWRPQKPLLRGGTCPPGPPGQHATGRNMTYTFAIESSPSSLKALLQIYVIFFDWTGHTDGSCYRKAFWNTLFSPILCDISSSKLSKLPQTVSNPRAT